LARGKLGSKSLLAKSAAKSTSGTKGARGAGMRAGAGYSGGLASGVKRNVGRRKILRKK